MIVDSPPRLELIFDAVLKTLPPDLHRGQDEAVPDEVRCVSHAFTRLKTATKESVLY